MYKIYIQTWFLTCVNNWCVFLDPLLKTQSSSAEVFTLQVSNRLPSNSQNIDQQVRFYFQMTIAIHFLLEKYSLHGILASFWGPLIQSTYKSNLDDTFK